MGNFCRAELRNPLLLFQEIVVTRSLVSVSSTAIESSLRLVLLCEM